MNEINEYKLSFDMTFMSAAKAAKVQNALQDMVLDPDKKDAAETLKQALKDTEAYFLGASIRAHC